jgi:hypothetical protein
MREDTKAELSVFGLPNKKQERCPKDWYFRSWVTRTSTLPAMIKINDDFCGDVCGCDEGDGDDLW